MCLNTYSTSKLACEELCKMYYSLYDVKTVIFRYFNVYGDRQPTKGQYSQVMGIFLRQKQNGESLTIHGDGQQSRDFVNVRDVARANIIAAQTDIPRYGEIFNVGSGQSITIQEIADLISDNQIHLPGRKGEALQSRADIRKIENTFNWHPTISVRDWIKLNVKYIRFHSQYLVWNQ
jgi:UDP-glucose 4-epimerase